MYGKKMLVCQVTMSAKFIVARQEIPNSIPKEAKFMHNIL